MSNRISNLLFVITIIAFLAIKWDYIFLSYFWDELGVYAQCMAYMATHRISLMPASVPPELSRGHPLLFSFIYSIVFKISGFSKVAVHLFSLLVTINFALAIYKFIQKHYNVFFAWFGIVYYLAQPIVLTQSGLVLPEILVAYFIFKSLIFAYEEKWFWYVIFASFAILTKESGIIIPIIVGVLHVIQHIKSGSICWKNYVKISVPLVVFSIFLCVQYLQNSWFLFPLHESLIVLNFELILQQIQRALCFIFIDQHRFVITILSLSIYLIWSRKKWHKICLMACFSIVIILLFQGFNFYMNRYLIMAYPFSILIFVELMSHIRWYKYLLIGLGIISILASFYDYKNSEMQYDENLHYKSYCKFQEKLYDKVRQYVSIKDSVYANFPINAMMMYKYNGYSDDIVYKKLNTHHSERLKWQILITNDMSLDIQEQNKFFIIDSVKYKNKKGVILTRIVP